jgi:RNA polymerase sigma-70 factor (ECF subfamily)
VNERLLKLAREGDPKALDELLSSMEPQILRFGMSMCGHQQDAEDVLQDTMLSVAQALPSFRGESGLSTWVYRIARNACSKKRRTSKFAPSEEQRLANATDDVAGGPDPEASAERRQDWQRVSRALGDLDADLREALVLRDVEGLSASETSDVLGVSEAAVKSRLHRARKALRHALGGLKRRGACPDIATAFSKNLEGELTASACADMEAHLSTCKHCQKICDGLKADLRTCQAAPGKRVSPELAQRIRKAIKEIPISNALSTPKPTNNPK